MNHSSIICLVSLVFYGVLVVSSTDIKAKTVSKQPKTKTVQGYYCGYSTGNRAGDFGFRVGEQVMVFHVNFDQPRGNAKLIGFIGGKVGEEFTVKYQEGGDTLDAHLIKATGRTKKIAPCTVE